MGAAAYVVYKLSPSSSPAGRLTQQLENGMSLREVESQAKKLGFEWRVDATRLEQKRPSRSRTGEDKPGQIICHEGDEEGKPPRLAGWHCEDFRDTKSFGVFFTSYACHVTIKGGKVTDVWFYAD